MEQSPFGRLPSEVVELIFDQLLPSSQERFHPQTDDPKPGSKAWLRRYGSWMNICTALRLTCRSFSESRTLRTALFYNINYLATPQSLRRIAAISFDDELVALVKRVTFYSGPFKQMPEGDPYDELNFEEYESQLGLETRGRIWQSFDRKDVFNPRKHEEVQTIEETTPAYTDRQKRDGFEAFHLARQTSWSLMEKHLWGHKGDPPVHAPFFARMSNVEEIALSFYDWNIESNDSFKSKWATRNTFLHLAFPELLIRYLPPSLPPFDTIPRPTPVAIKIATSSSLRPKQLHLGIPTREGIRRTKYELTSEILECVDDLQFPDPSAADPFLGHSALSQTLRKISIGREWDGYQPPSHYWTQWADLNFRTALPRLQTFRVSCMKAVSTHFLAFLQSLHELRYLKLQNFTLHDFEWRQLFETIRAKPRAFIFDFDGLHPICPGFFSSSNYPVHLTSSRTPSDLKLISFVEGEEEWSEELTSIWVEGESVADVADESD